MNNAGTVFHGYVFVAYNVECFFAECLCLNAGALKQGLVFLILKIFSSVSFNDLVGSGGLLVKHLFAKRFCQIICVSVGGLYLYIAFNRVYAESYV